MKVDYIIQNPPYANTLHIDFFKKGIELLNDTGKIFKPMAQRQQPNYREGNDFRDNNRRNFKNNNKEE